MSAIGGKADVTPTGRHVGNEPIPDIQSVTWQFGGFAVVGRVTSPSEPRPLGAGS